MWHTWGIQAQRHCSESTTSLRDVICASHTEGLHMPKFTFLFLSNNRNSFGRSIKAYAYLKPYICIYANIYISAKIPMFKEKLSYRANFCSALGKQENRNKIFVAVRSSVFTFPNFHPLLTFVNWYKLIFKNSLSWVHVHIDFSFMPHPPLFHSQLRLQWWLSNIISRKKSGLFQSVHQVSFPVMNFLGSWFFHIVASWSQ